MRVMVLVKADVNSEQGALPPAKLLEDMMAYNEELVKAGIMVAGEGLKPSSQGVRIRFSGDQRTVTRAPSPRPASSSPASGSGRWSRWRRRGMGAKRCPIRSSRIPISKSALLCAFGLRRGGDPGGGSASGAPHGRHRRPARQIHVTVTDDEVAQAKEPRPSLRGDRDSMDAAFRAASPAAMAALLRGLGTLDRAEDAFQEACLRALATGGARPAPRSDVVAGEGRPQCRIDRLRRHAERRGCRPSIWGPRRRTRKTGARGRPRPDGLGDDVLRLLFICCHPDLATAHQIALALRVVCGLSVPEIARVFLMGEAAMEQRISPAPGAGWPRPAFPSRRRAPASGRRACPPSRPWSISSSRRAIRHPRAGKRPQGAPLRGSHKARPPSGAAFRGARGARASRFDAAP